MNIERYKLALQRLNFKIQDIQEKYHCSKFRIWTDALCCYIRYGVTPSEYIGFGFYYMNGLGKKQFYTARKTKKVEGRLNNKGYSDTFWDKVKFNKHFADWVRRDWLYAPYASDEEITEFIKNHKKIIVKPTKLSSGRGIRLYTDQSAASLKKEKYILEDFIIQHNEMQKLNPTSLNSVRVYTVIDKQNEVQFLSATVRVGGMGSCVDNFYAGGVGYPIDLDTGIICAAGSDIKGNNFLIHPGSNAKVIGLEIPNWNELKKFVSSACMHIPSSRFIAWDVAVLENGFEMIEGNYDGDPGMMQTPLKTGKWYEIKKCL